jgi:hypothetical protein
MNIKRKLSFTEGMAKLAKDHKDKIRNNDFLKKENNILVSKEKKDYKKKLHEEFIWVSENIKPKKVNLNLSLNDMEECFSLESFKFSSGNKKIKFLLSGFSVRRPWILWTQEWNSNQENFMRQSPILGFSNKDADGAEDAIVKLFLKYINLRKYKIDADFIEGSLLISDDKVLELIKSE